MLPWLNVTSPFFGSMNFSLLNFMGLAGSGELRIFVAAIFIAGGLSVILSLAVRNHRVGRIVPALTGLVTPLLGARHIYCAMA
jgi:hypothetical protein